MIWKNIFERYALGIVAGISLSVLMITGITIAAAITVDDRGRADYAKIQEMIDASANDTWSVTRNGTTVEISYGSDTTFLQYAALHMDSGYFRMVAPGTNWGTSVVLLPSFWENGSYYQGAPVTYEWFVEGSDLILFISGNISNLTANAKIHICPPTGDIILANVEGNVTGNIELDNRTGEAFKPLMLSSMHVSSELWDAYSAYAGSTEFSFPEEGWFVSTPLNSSVFGLKGGSSEWKNNAPTVEIHLNKSYEVMGWVTNSSNPNDDNVGFWAASSDIIRSWNYTIEARKEPSNIINKTVYVDDNFTDDPENHKWDTIQKGINDSVDGDMVVVNSGTYYENVNITKKLTLVGIDTGEGKPIIKTSGTITISYDGTVLDGFIITYSGFGWLGTSLDTLIYVKSENNTITRNIIGHHQVRYAITIDSHNNNTISNNIINNDIKIQNTYNSRIESNNIWGICIQESNSSKILYNYIRPNPNGPALQYIEVKGISLLRSNQNIIKGNIIDAYPKWITGSQPGGISTSNVATNSNNNLIEDNNFINTGLSINNSYKNIVINNSVNGKSLVYFEDVTDKVISQAGQVIAVNSTNITVKDLTIVNTSTGIQLWNTNNITIVNNSITGTSIGLELYYSSESNIIDNILNENDCGICIHYSNYNNKIDGNKIYSNGGGWSPNSIYLQNSSDNYILNNNISNNTRGIYVYSSNGNYVKGNNISNNPEGISIEYSHNNTIFQNNFMNNSPNALVLSTNNSWDSGYPSGGNYWSDYKGADLKSGSSQNTPGSDGIGDIPYDITGGAGAQDRYPFIAQDGWKSSVPTPTPGTKGDVSGDGQVSVVDALFIAQYTVGTRNLTSTQLAAADVNGDGQVTIVDALFIAQYTVGVRQL